jgi:hypothetical protein
MRITRQVSILVSSIVFSVALAWCQYPRDDVIVDFQKISRAQTRADSVTGTLYYRRGDFAFIHTRHPIEQWIWVLGQTLTVYYPAEKRALRLRDTTPVQLPFFEAFLNADGAELGLTRMGFRVATSSFDGDSLVTDWVSPESVSKQISGARTVYRGDRLAGLEFIDPAGHPLARTRYGQYCEFGSAFFPLQIVTTRYQPSFVVEHMSFSPPTFDSASLDSIAALRVPPDVAIDDIGEQ